jgi:hypothetical protein
MVRSQHPPAWRFVAADSGVRDISTDDSQMTFEMFGAECFGAVIGFVAWHVFRAGESSSGVKQLVTFIGALAGAVALAAFPAGTTLFVTYSCGLALGFFPVPGSRLLGAGLSSLAQGASISQPEFGKEVPDQLAYIDEHWPEVELVVKHALLRHEGSIRESHIQALPLDASGRVSALRRYARTYPDRASFGAGWAGLILRSLDDHEPASKLRAT